MVLASCSFRTQAHTCFDSSQSWHVLRKRKRREVVAGVSCLPVVVPQQLTDWNADRAGSHFQLWWKMARKDSKDTVHSRAMTPRGVSLAPVLAPYVGALLLFSLDCRPCLSPQPTFNLFILPSLCICLCAPLHLPAPLHCQKPLPGSALVPLSLPRHIHPRALLALAPALDKSCWDPSTAPSPPARQQTVPRAPLLCRGTGKDGSSSAGDGSSQPQLPLSPQPPCASPVAVRGCNQQRKTC